MLSKADHSQATETPLPLKLFLRSRSILAPNLCLSSSKHQGTLSTGPPQKGMGQQGWGDGQAPDFGGSEVSGCSFPPAHGARDGFRCSTGSFPAQFRFAGALKGCERNQGWLSSESKPPQSHMPQREPGSISQREIGSQFHQLGEVTLRLALSLSAVLGSCPLLTFSWAKARDAAGASLCSSEGSRSWSTPHKSRISMAELNPRTGKESQSLDGATHTALAASSLPCKNVLPHVP